MHLQLQWVSSQSEEILRENEKLIKSNKVLSQQQEVLHAREHTMAKKNFGARQTITMLLSKLKEQANVAQGDTTTKTEVRVHAFVVV